MLVLEDISVSFNNGLKLQNKVLHRINMQLKQGELVAVIGSNGAGKSTLINTISGEIQLESGTITIAGGKINSANAVTKVVQDPRQGTIANMTIEENLAFAMSRGQNRNLKLSIDQQKRSLFINKLKILGIKLEDRLDELVSNLSGGQRQALSLVMATLVPAKVLLLDEHTAALDPSMAKIIMQITKNLILNDQMVGLMITHNMSQALYFADRIIIMHEGRILRQICGMEKNKLTPGKLIKLLSQNHLL